MEDVIRLNVIEDEQIKLKTETAFRGEKGEKGTTFIPEVSEDGVLSWTNSDGLENPESVNIRGPQGIQGIQGEPGADFTYDDFTAEQLEALRGPQGIQGEKGETGEGLNIKGSYESEEQLRSEHPNGSIGDGYVINGYLYVWDEVNSDWLNAGQIQGPAGPQGIQGEKGDPLKYEDLTQDQKDEIKNSVINNIGDVLDNFATKDYVAQNGGKINSISVYDTEVPIDSNKNVNLELSNIQVYIWEDGDTIDSINS